jgi:hypothetical protein
MFSLAGILQHLSPDICWIIQRFGQETSIDTLLKRCDALFERRDILLDAFSRVSCLLELRPGLI